MLNEKDKTMSDKEHHKDTRSLKPIDVSGSNDSFVLDKGIFSNIFEKDIRRVYIYKKTERLAKAIHLISPAFTHAPALRNRIDAVAIGLIDAAVLPPASARGALSRELLALSSMLSIARAGGVLSQMNADLIGREAHVLLQEVAAYEEPRLFLEEAPTLASLFKSVGMQVQVDPRNREGREQAREAKTVVRTIKDNKGHVSDNSATPEFSARRDSIVQVLKSKGPSYIKDISVVIRSVSEKTIQRELSALVAEGIVEKRGERRWTTYALVS